MNTKTAINTKTLVIVALFVALSFVGAQIRIFGTIAFDSLAGFLAALLLGPVYGAAIGFLGHLFTAMTAGFPLSVPLHLVIAGTMALAMYGFGITYRIASKTCSQAPALTIAGVAGIILNGPVSLAFSIGALWLMAGREAALGLLALLPILTLAALANIALSIMIFKSLEKVWNKII